MSAVRLTVLIASPLTGEQGNLLDTSWRDPGAAEAALERVRAELGPDVVVKPHAHDGYTPERSGKWREVEMFSAAASPKMVLVGPAENVLRLLESPEHVDVDHDESPRRIFWRGRAIPVINAIGPERLSGDWWDIDGWVRDEWDVALADGTLCRLAHDLRTGAWLLDAIYD